MGAHALPRHRPADGRTARTPAIGRGPARLGDQDLAPPRHRPGRALRRIDDRALVLQGPARSRSSGGTQGRPAWRRGRLPEHDARGHCSVDAPIPRACRLDGAAAPGQPARGLQGGRLDGGLVCDGAPLSARPGHASPGAPHPSDRRRHCSPRSAGTTGGSQLRGRARLGAMAPGLPPRLAQGAHPRRRLDQADAVGRHRRPFASALSPAVVPR